MSAIELSDWKTDPLKKWPRVDDAAIRESMGFIPAFLTTHEGSAAAQFDAAYQKYGGWSPMAAWVMDDQGVLRYPGDEPVYPAAILEKSDGETVRFYPGAWVSIRQPNGDYEVARLD